MKFMVQQASAELNLKLFPYSSYKAFYKNPLIEGLGFPSSAPVTKLEKIVSNQKNAAGAMQGMWKVQRECDFLILFTALISRHEALNNTYGDLRNSLAWARVNKT